MIHKAAASTTTLLFWCSCALLTWRQTDGFLAQTPATATATVTFTVTPSRSFAAVPAVVGTPSSRLYATEEKADGISTPSKAPVLNGKRVLPFKVLMGGLTGHKNVAGVYALINADYARGSAGWEQCEHVGVSYDLESTLTALQTEKGADTVAHVRVMSFVIPSEGAMQSIADDWRMDTTTAGGRINFDPVLAAVEMPLDDDDYDDEYMDEDDVEFMQMTAEAMAMGSGPSEPVSAAATAATDGDDIVSPFEMPPSAAVTTTAAEKIVFNKENVDKVLDEVRPYLISDGGNVSVERVDEETQNVYLKLEGACGSCPSSTVTMQMGIERVLKENFADLGEVLRVEEEDATPKELSYEMVATEVNRISPAIIAMGGSMDIISVDGDTGIVELKFKGAGKVRQGVELAIQDIDFVKEVRFQE